MNRKEFLKKITVLSSGIFLTLKSIIPLNAQTKSSTFHISEECIGCEKCVEESQSENFAMKDGSAIFQQGCVGAIWDNGKTASAGTECADEILKTAEICPVDAIQEIG